MHLDDYGDWTSITYEELDGVGKMWASQSVKGHLTPDEILAKMPNFATYTHMRNKSPINMGYNYKDSITTMTFYFRIAEGMDT